MAIEFQIDEARGSEGTLFVLFRCSDDEAAKLTAALRAAYRGRGTPSQVVRAPLGARFGYCCRIPDSRAGFERLWPQVSLKVLLAGGVLPGQAGKPQGGRRTDPEPRAPAGPSPQAEAKDGDGALPTCAPAQASGLPPVPSSAPDTPSIVAPAVAYARADLQGDESRTAPEDDAPDSPESRPEPRLSELRAMLAQGDAAAVHDAIGAETPDPAARTLLGMALLALGYPDRALPHLRFGWDHGHHQEEAALPLARGAWDDGEYEAAVGPYHLALAAHPEALAPRDLLALVELAENGDLPGIGIGTHLRLIERFFTDATPDEQNTHTGRKLAARGLELARALGDEARLQRAYGQLLDMLIERHDAAGLVALLDGCGGDYWTGRLGAAAYLELLDEVADSREDFDERVWERLRAGLTEVARRALEEAAQTGVPVPTVRDVYKTLRGVERNHPLLAPMRQALTNRHTDDPTDTLDDANPNLAGRRIALVGGHERTREHVRRRLAGWGARVDEVPPPNNGRIAEREVLDRIAQSDLIVLIIRYMGHDMSTAVYNLQDRGALRGQVLPIDCRGVAGVCREIIGWAAHS